MKKIINTVIIGAGISGLGCARTLYDNNKRDFLMISEDIGGRILMSKKGSVPYGAYFIGPDYDNTSKYIERERKIDLLSIRFHKGRKSYLTLTSIRYPLQMLRLILAIYKFRRHYSVLKKECINISQKQAIKKDKYLYELYNKKAKDFLEENGLQDIADKYLGEIAYGLSFCRLDEIYAFEFLRWIQYIIMPIYEFKFLKNKIIKGFKQKIIIDSVVSVKKENKYYKIKTKKGREWTAKNIVIATPIHISQKLIKIKKIKKPATAYMFHIKGEIKDKWDDIETHMFNEDFRVFDIAHQADGTYLFYCNNPKPKLNKYFKKYKVIAKKFWNPAFNIRGNELIECKRDENLYLIGDYNIVGMEDSFITGIYAANQIIGNK